MKRSYYPASGGYKRIILLPFLVLITLSFLAAWALYLLGSRQAVNDLIGKLSWDSAKKAESDLYAFLDRARQTALLNSAYCEGLPSRDLQTFTLPKIFLRELATFPELEIVSAAFGDGEYREAQRLESGLLRLGIAGERTGGALSFFLNSAGTDLEEVDSVPDYDPRKRPWYISARAHEGPSWSDPYHLYSNSDLAISAAVPFTTREGMEGVTTACIVLSHISRFLTESLDPSLGSIHIVDRKGYRVASNHGFSTVIDGNGEQLQDGAVNGASRFRTEIAVDSDSYPPWRVIVDIDDRAFTAPIIKADLITAFILLGLLLLFFLVGWLIVNRVTRPIRALQEAVQMSSPIEDTPDQSLPRLASYKNEIGSLADSFMNMQLRIREDYSTLKKNLSEKELLLKEVHHRVKNNLQIVSSMLSLESYSIQDPRDRQSLELCQDRIQAMAFVHEDAYTSSRFTEVEMTSYLNRICRSLGATRPDLDVQVHTTPDPLFLPLDTAIPTGLIVNELVTNAIKYAFDATVDSPRIRIGLNSTVGELHLSVSDNGRGNNGQKANKSMGSDLIQALSAQIGGAIELRYEGGTRVSIRIPAPSYIHSD